MGRLVFARMLMAGDWIKMRNALWTHPKVSVVALRLNVNKAMVIGALHGVWGIFDQHSEDGTIFDMLPDMIDTHVGLQGFVRELSAVGWLTVTDRYIQLPRYEEHNGPTGKRRALDQRRKQLERNELPRPKKSGQNADAMRTRGEERREEENKTNPPTPQGGVVRFDEFWATYPKCERKDHKSICRRLWASKGLDVVADAILTALRRAKTSRQWLKDDGQFIPYPKTWLSRKPWETDPSEQGHTHGDDGYPPGFVGRNPTPEEIAGELRAIGGAA